MSSKSDDEDARVLAILVANRRSRRIPYAFLMAAATCSLLVEQSNAVQTQFTSIMSTAFSVFWVLSSLLCFLGTATDFWILEWWGLTPMFLSFITFGVTIIGFGFITGWAVLPAGLSLVGIGGLFRSRRKDVNILWAWSGGRV